MHPKGSYEPAGTYLARLFARDPVCPGCGHGENSHVVMVNGLGRWYVACLEKDDTKC